LNISLLRRMGLSSVADPFFKCFCSLVVEDNEKINLAGDNFSVVINSTRFFSLFRVRFAFQLPLERVGSSEFF